MSVHPAVARPARPLWRVSAEERTRDHRFFLTMGAAAALIVFVGFAPTYYLRRVFGGPDVTALVHLHGIVSTAWILLYIAQSSLVSARRIDLHRRLGVAGVLVALLLLGVGVVTALEGARRGLAPPAQGVSALGFLAVPLTALLSFAVLAGLGLGLRRRPETHKRLMLLATLAILVPALARLRFIAGGGPSVVIGGMAVLVGICLAYDRLAHGRIHPAFLWGGPLLVLSLPLRFAVARTATWESIAAWLIR